MAGKQKSGLDKLTGGYGLLRFRRGRRRFLYGGGLPAAGQEGQQENQRQQTCRRSFHSHQLLEKNEDELIVLYHGTRILYALAYGQNVIYHFTEPTYTTVLFGMMTTPSFAYL